MTGITSGASVCVCSSSSSSVLRSTQTLRQKQAQPLFLGSGLLMGSERALLLASLLLLALLLQHQAWKAEEREEGSSLERHHGIRFIPEKGRKKEKKARVT